MTKRTCGECRECCIVLEVDAMQKPNDVPCRHLCSAGCGIYNGRPQSCREFTCGWLEGMLGPADRPSRTHMVLWITNMLSPTGKRFVTLQCNIRAGAKRHKKTMAWLRHKSFGMPVLVVQGDKCELISLGKSIVKWNHGDFIHVDCDDGGHVIRGHVVPRDTVLLTPDETAAWEKVHLRPEVLETNPVWRREQLNYLEKKREQL